MPEQQGRVVETQDELALIRHERKSQCGKCDSRSACGSTDSDRENEVWVLNPLGAQIGDEVVVDIPATSLLIASLLVYLFPLVLMVIGGVLGGAFTSGDSSYAMLGGVLGFGIAFLLIRRFNPLVNHDERFSARISQIL